MDIGAAVSSKTLLTDEELADIARFEDSPLFNEREKWVMRYAEAMSQTSVTVPDALFAQLKQHFDEAQIVELTASIAYENYRARFNHALDIQSDNLYVCEWQPNSVKQSH